MLFEAVLFDFFDTLVLVEGGEDFYEPSLRKLFDYLVASGVSVEYEAFRKIYFEQRDRLYSETLKTLEEPHFNLRISRTLEELGYNFSVVDKTVVEATMAFAGEFANFVHPDEDAILVLDDLRKKCKLGIVSNFAIPECLLSLLDRFDMRRFFDIIVISGAMNKRKPSREIFQAALNALYVDAERTVFVGDTPSMDIDGAKRMGMRAILIERKSKPVDKPRYVWTPPETNGNFSPDNTIRRLSELPAILSQY